MSDDIRRWVQQWLHSIVIGEDDVGQGLVEYALILLLVAIIVIVVVAVFGSSVGNLYSNAVNAI